MTIQQLEGKNLLTQTELAAKLGVCSQTVFNWCKQGRLHPIKIGGKLRFTDELPTDLIKTNKKVNEPAAA